MNVERGMLLRTRMAVTAALVAVLAVALVLGGCGSPATAPVIIVTATPTTGPVVLVVTATPTAGAPADTPTPEFSQEQILTAQAILTKSAPPVTDLPTVAMEPTAEVAPTDTPEPPPPPPTDTPELPQVTEEAAPAATDTPVPPPTDTPKPPAATTVPTPKPTAKPAASLASYGVIYSQFDGGPESDPNKYSVWVVRGDGTSATKIIQNATMPAFSPNGQKIAYYRTFEGIAVYDMNKKTTTMTVPSNWAEFSSFSPDGKQLVFHEWVGSWWSADVSLYVVNSDGSGRYKLVPGERPVWSPKGDLIAYDTCQGSACGIFVVKPNGQGVRQVTSDAGGNAAWSPDGKKIAYCSSKDGDPEIWVVNLDGKGMKQLTKNSGNDTNPAFSPDGNYIFFLSDQNGTAWAVRVMRADGSDVKTVRKIGVAPRWQFARMWAGWW